MPADRESIRALAAARLDWSSILRLSKQHQLSALLYDALAAADLLDCLPAETRQALQEARLGHVAQTSRHRYWRRRILARLAAAGIPVIVLKGSFLAEAVYPQPYLRPMADLDLLTPRADYQAARAALADLGYAVVGDYNYGEEHNLALGKDSLLVHTAQQGMPVEVHWDLTRRAERQSEPDLTRIWARAQPWTVDDVPALAMSLEDLLLHLCLHLASEFHCFDRLIWFSDIDAVIRHPVHRLDWSQFVQAARTDQATTAAYTALSLCQYLLGTPVPAPVLQVLAPSPPLRWLIRWLLPPVAVVHHVSTLRRLAAKYALVDGCRERWRLTREHLLPAPITLRGAYHLEAVPTGSRLALAYLRHLGTITRRFAERVARTVVSTRLGAASLSGRGGK